MSTSIKNSIKKVLIFCLAYAPMAWTSHNTSRYFPFLESTQDYIIKNRSHFTPTFFYVNASNAELESGGKGGIPELWGKYNLNDVINSLETVRPTAPNPIFTVTGSTELEGKSIAFFVNSRTTGVGFSFGYEQDLHFCGFQVGAWIPVIAIKTTARYEFNRQGSDPIFNNPALTPAEKFNQDLLVDKIRRVTHQEIGFGGN